MPSRWVLFAGALVVLGLIAGPLALVAVPLVLIGRKWGRATLAVTAFVAFLVAGVAAAAGIRWALAGPGLAIVACSAIVLVSRSLPPLRRGAPGIRPWRSAPSARSLPE